MGHLRDTLYTSTCFHLFLLMQQEETDRETAIWWQYAAIWRQSAAFCHILPSPTNLAKFCQDRYLNPTLLYICVDQATKLTIYTLSSYFLTFFPYATSWLYYTVYVHSLIISTLLYIIITYTYSVTLRCVNPIYYPPKYRTTLKPL